MDEGLKKRINNMIDEANHTVPTKKAADIHIEYVEKLIVLNVDGKTAEEIMEKLTKS